MFFIRSILGLGVVFALLPVAPEDQDKIEHISPIEAIGAAANAMRDMSGFCDRNPQTCVTGGKAAVAIGYKAKFGAQQLLERVQDTDAEADIQTSAIPQKANSNSPQINQALPTQIAKPTVIELRAAPTPRARPNI